MIDEKKLIEELKKHPNLFKEFGWTMECIDIGSVIETINEQPQADKWIPCEERLPSEQNQYLVSLEGYCKPMIAYFSTENKKWYWYNSTAEMRYVIAWQPLPTPYKKEGAE